MAGVSCADEADERGMIMDLHQIIYMFEHRMLPQYFFEDREKFVWIILENKGILYQIINEIFEKEQMENPYSPEQFGVMSAKITEDVMMLKLIFPEPQEEPLCYCSYLFFDREFKKMGFFCIEKGNEYGEASSLLDGSRNME